MKKQKKILLSLGVVATIVAPIATIISCGVNNNKQQNELNKTSVQQIENALIQGHKINLKDPVTNNTNQNPLDVNISVNGVDGVDMKITSWVPEVSKNSIIFTTSLSKKGLKSKEIKSGVLFGFADTDQQKFDSITSVQISKAFDKKVNKKLSVLAHTNTQPSQFSSTIDGLVITIAPQSWKPQVSNNFILINVLTTYKTFSKTYTGLKLTGFADTDQQKFDSITSALISKAFDSKIYKNLSVISKANIQPSQFSRTINNIKITIAPLSWNPEVLNNSISLDVLITYKTHVKIYSKTYNSLKLTGFADTDQQRMNQIQSKDVSDLIYSKLDKRYAVTDWTNAQIKTSTLKFRARNFVVTTSNWIADNPTHTITFDAVISYPTSTEGQITSKTFAGLKLTGFTNKINTVLNNYNDTDQNLVSWNATTQTVTIKSATTMIAINAMPVFPNGKFKTQQIKNIVFAPNSQVKTIGIKAFQNLNILTSIKIPESVITIGADAFYNDTFTVSNSITLPSKLKYVGLNAFNGSRFSKITFLGKCPTGTSRNMILRSGAFGNTYVSAIQGTNTASQAKWQAWATKHKNAFD